MCRPKSDIGELPKRLGPGAGNNRTRCAQYEIYLYAIDGDPKHIKEAVKVLNEELAHRGVPT